MDVTPDRAPFDPIFTIDEAAEYLGIPKATLYTWRTRRVGFGPRALKLGGCLRFRRSDLDSWIVAHLEVFDGENEHEDEGRRAAPESADELTDESTADASKSLRGKATTPNTGVMTRRRSRR